MNILVTGGAGFIGSNLVHYLLSDSASEVAPVSKVVNLDVLTYAGNPQNLKGIEGDDRHVFVEGDIGDSALVSGLLATHDIDAIMHLAAESHVDRSIDGPEPFLQTNVIGTLRLLEAAKAHAASKAGFRFLHVSTDEVYGSLGADDPAFCEETPFAPNSPYSASKAGSDHLARAYHHTFGLDVVTTNCSNNYGPFQFPEDWFPLMIQKVLAGEDLPVYGDGTNVRDWLYVGDHATGLFKSLVKGKAGETYCIGGRCEMQNLDVIKTLIDSVQAHMPESDRRPADEIITFVKDRPGHDARYAINCDKIERELGWTPAETFESGMAKTVSWYLANQAWIKDIENGNYQGQRLGDS